MNQAWIRSCVALNDLIFHIFRVQKLETEVGPESAYRYLSAIAGPSKSPGWEVEMEALEGSVVNRFLV